MPMRKARSAKEKVSELYDSDIENAHKTWKGLCEKRKSFLDPLEKAEKACLVSKSLRSEVRLQLAVSAG